MKLIHLSDIHLGKRVNEFSMLEDQQYILTEIINIVDAEMPDAVLIAGDIYDKSVPPAEAVQLFDDFLTALAKRRIHVFLISGNHDSGERIAFGSRLMHGSGIHMSGVYDGTLTPISLQDKYGTVDFYLLPFIKPAHVRRYFEEETIENYSDAVECVINHSNVIVNRKKEDEADSAQKAQGESAENIENHRKVILAHQFVTGADRCESEDISVGGSDNVDAKVFEGFDYVALGHLHGPQNMTGPHIRYSGTPLKYSFSESNHKKSVTVVELKEKGKITVNTLPLTPLRDMREIKGTYMEVTAKSFYEETNTDDYLHITLTDEEDIPDAVGKLRVIYPNLMKLDYDNQRTQANRQLDYSEDNLSKSPMDLFSEFYQQRNNQPMSEEQHAFLEKLMEEIWEDEQ